MKKKGGETINLPTFFRLPTFKTKNETKYILRIRQNLCINATKHSNALVTMCAKYKTGNATVNCHVGNKTFLNDYSNILMQTY